MKACSAIVHVSPAAGAKFTQYTAEFEVGGELGPTTAQRFIFVIEGGVKVEGDRRPKTLGPRGSASFPEGFRHQIMATKVSRLVVIEKSYRPLDSVEPPQLIVSNEDVVSSHPLGDDPDLQVKCLLPDEMSFDFAV